jgi:hypothetical protein
MFTPLAFNQESIVTRGLVFYLDAADRTSYSPGSGVWRDLSGNGNNGTLVNGPTFNSENGGNIVFDGTDDYTIVTSTTPPSLQGDPNFTVCGWFKKSGNWSNGATWGIGGDSTLQGINSFNFNNSNEISIDLWGRATLSTGETYSGTDWKFIVWCKTAGIFNPTNISIYVNLVKYTGNNFIILRSNYGTPNINSNGIVLARAGVNTNNYYGKPIISNLKIYNRVLTEQEITQNYNALKGRFGL